MSKHQVKVWNTKVTTIEQLDEDSNVLCKGCEAVCCKGAILPFLTEKECFSGKYPLKFINVPELKKEVPNAENVATLAISECGCFFLKNNKCIIYESRPKACRVYDCRKDDRPEIKELVKLRFK